MQPNIQAEKMKKLLRTFNKGIKDVTLEYGIFQVTVSNKKSAMGVITDLRLSRAFRDINYFLADDKKNILINAVPA